MLNSFLISSAKLFLCVSMIYCLSLCITYEEPAYFFRIGSKYSANLSSSPTCKDTWFELLKEPSPIK